VDGIDDVATVGVGDADVLEESDITEIVLSPPLVTNISPLPEPYAAPVGEAPTFRVSTIALVISDMTETELDP
jgi:hypothetical protein